MMLLCCGEPSPPPPPVGAPIPTSVPTEAAVEILDRPIPFDAHREALTLAYLRAHVDPQASSVEMSPRAIVLHWTASPTFEASHRIFVPTTLQGRGDLDDAGRVNVSAHFLVDRDGTIARLMPETTVGRHTIGLNQVAIGIENVGGGPEHPLTDAQARANADLVRNLAQRHPITHLLGHHEYRQMESHPYFSELDPDYRTTKVDPGEAFLADVRRRVADLGLLAPPP